MQYVYAACSATGASMAADRKKPGKTESLTIRLDPKTKFVIDFIARVKGQSITTVVERAIMDAADGTDIGSHQMPETWRDFWSVSDGVRALKIASDSRLYPSYEEEFLVNFARIHWPFFYLSARKGEFHMAYVDILWPKIHEFLEIWQNTKSSDYFAAGKVMQEAIRAAGVRPPEWPAATAPTPPPPSVPPRHEDLDDEIPF